MTGSIRIASRADLEGVAAVMDKGFAADPTVRWVLPEDRDFKALHHRHVGLYAEAAIDLGAVHVFGGFAGAAIWRPPGVEVDDAAQRDLARMVPRQDVFSAFSSLVEACERNRPPEAHWTLELVAVDPAWRGEGIGAKLLAYGLEICDRDGAPVYLESSNPANLTLYRRHGFELLAEVQAPRTPKRYPMLRNARKRGDSAG